jgi:uncharacterized protein YllA (UPF0747 family)
MESNCHYITYEKTGYFSKVVSDYLSGDEQLKPFYQYPVSIAGIKESIHSRETFNTNRTLLVEELRKQYHGMTLSPKQETHLESLLSNNVFTVTTAHQPNIFTGPLYFIYKILHTIKLADELTIQLPDYKFVPVYYMGSEDADLEELGYINLNGEKLDWQTKQTGAVGRMKVDKAFVKLIDVIYGQIGVQPHGKELTDLFKQSYTEGKTIQQATLELVNSLFADFGLLILIPDNPALKQSFNKVVEKEIREQFSHKAVEETINELSRHYKVQTGGREINLFYLLDDKRERIQRINEGVQVATDPLEDPRCQLHDIPNNCCKRNEQGLRFEVQGAGLMKQWCEREIIEEMNEFPDRFSGNVILRGVFQETVLPNIAFIGGGGELAYWLELRKVFKAVNVPYPMLILRNSFLLITPQQQSRLDKLGFSPVDLFKEEQQLLTELVAKESSETIHLNGELDKIRSFYQHIKVVAGNIDPTLGYHTEALQAKALKPLHELEKKMLRAEKRKYTTQREQIAKLKQELFPNNNLQERTENFSLNYARYGKEWLQSIYSVSKGLEQKFGIFRTGEE